MSIITEALHKIQNERSEKIAPAVPAPKAPASAKNIKRGNSFVVPIAAVLFIIVTAGATLLYFNHQTFSGQTAKIQQDEPVEAPIVMAHTRITPASATENETSAPSKTNIPAKPVKTKGLPILSGIMYSPVNPQAIINGALVSAGEIVDGYSVAEILPESVKLTSSSGELELRLR